MVKYSIIVLLDNRHEDFAEFISNIYNIFFARWESFEIIIMANGTSRFLHDKMPELQNFCNHLKAFEFRDYTSEAVCLKAGFRESTGDIIVACGSYQQISNESFVKVVGALDDDTDIVSPWRRKRIDAVLSRVQSKVFNWIVRKITRFELHDLSCTVKIFRRKVLEETELYGGMYRFLPILAARKGFKTREVECEHFQQRGKSGFYPLSDYVVRLLDIFTLYFNTRFTRKPLRFFSSIGMGFIGIGFVIFSYEFIERFFMGRPVGDQSVLLLGLLFMGLGVQGAGIGLLGEIISFTLGRHRKEYTIDKTI